MRKRSTRLFGILIHLIVHYSRRRNPGVHPLAIILERLSAEEIPNAALAGIPFWLQDDSDGLCLNNVGSFSACGDANLWRLVRLNGGANLLEQEDALFSYALQWLDVHGDAFGDEDMDDYENVDDVTWWNKLVNFFRRDGEFSQHSAQHECLTMTPYADRAVHLEPCKRVKGSKKMWSILPNGRIAWHDPDTNQRHCLMRDFNNTVRLDSNEAACNDQNSSAVDFSLIRFSAARTPEMTLTEIQQPPLLSTSSSRDSSSSFRFNESQGKTGSLRPMHSALTPMTGRQTSEILRQSHPSLHMPLRHFDRTHDAVLSENQEVEEKAESATQRQFHTNLEEMPRHPYLDEAKDGIWTDPSTELRYHTNICSIINEEQNCSSSTQHILTGLGQYTKTMLRLKIYGTALYVTLPQNAEEDAMTFSRLLPFFGLDYDQLKNNAAFYDLLMSAGSFDRTLLLNLNMQLSCATMRASLDADWQLLSPEHKAALNDMTLKPRLANEDMLNKILDEVSNPNRCSCGQIAPKEYEADTSCCARGSQLAYTWRTNGSLEVRLDGRLMDSFDDVEIGRGIFYEYLRMDDPMSVEARENFSQGMPRILWDRYKNDVIANPSLFLSSASLQEVSLKEEHHNQAINIVKQAIVSHIVNVTSTVQHSLQYAHDVIAQTAEDQKDQFISTSRLFMNSMRHMVMDWNDRRLRWMPHFPHHAHVDEMTNAEQQWGVATTSFSSSDEWGEEGGSCHTTTSARLTHGHILLDDRLNQIGCHLHDSQSFPNFSTLGSKNNHKPMSVTERLFLQRNYPTMRFSDEIGVMPMRRSNSGRSDNNSWWESSPHQIFFGMVHFYLVLLLIVSLPADQSTVIIVTKENTVSSNDDKGKVSSCASESEYSASLSVSLEASSQRRPCISEDRGRSLKKSLSYYVK